MVVKSPYHAHTLANILTSVINGEDVDPSDGILHHEENIDLLPGNIELSALEVLMGNVMSRELKARLIKLFLL